LIETNVIDLDSDDARLLGTTREKRLNFLAILSSFFLPLATTCPRAFLGTAAFRFLRPMLMGNINPETQVNLYFALRGTVCAKLNNAGNDCSGAGAEGNNKALKAISIRQPWAWAVIHGGKDIENRGIAAVRQMQSAIGQRIYVHAGTKVCSASNFEEIADFMRSIGVKPPDKEELRYGGVIGSVFVEDAVFPTRRKGVCVIGDTDKTLKSPWYGGDMGFLFRDPKPCRFIPARGQLGLFTVNRA
jgi:hypothetical protein